MSKVWILCACIALVWVLPDPGDSNDETMSASEFSRSVVVLQEEADTKADDYKPKGEGFLKACHVASRDLGVHDGYVKGVRRTMRLCGLPLVYSYGEESTPGKPYYIDGANHMAMVSAPASYNFAPLAKAARKKGIRLCAVSSYRTMSHQIDLWNGSDKTGKWVARPGYSNHQQGGAIDFCFPGVGVSSANCRWRGGVCTLRGHRTWNWLNANSTKFGVHQYVNEFWHFSPSGH